jgi:hypothetical protein
VENTYYVTLIDRLLQDKIELETSKLDFGAFGNGTACPNSSSPYLQRRYRFIRQLLLPACSARF